MTISEIDRLHSQLSRFEDMFPGYRTEIVEGNIVMSPVRPFHGRTIQRLWDVLEPQLEQGWVFVSDVAFPFDDANEFCPDLAVVPAAEERRNLSSYSPDLIEFAIEVVSPSSVSRDYELKPRWYASRGIANYLVFDPLKGHCKTFWNPGSDGYAGQDTVAYGTELRVVTSVGTLKIDTAVLPAVTG